MPQPATWTADRLTVGRVVRTGKWQAPVGGWDQVAAPLGSGSDRYGRQFAVGVAPQLEQVVGAAQQPPLRIARRQPAAQQPAGAADVLDLAEDRLDGLLALGVAGFAVLALQLGCGSISGTG